MISTSDLAEYVGANIDEDAELLSYAIDVATSLVDLEFESTWRAVPDKVRDECVKRTAMALFKQSATGDAGFTTLADGSVVAGTPNDPLRKSLPIIRKYTNWL